jgi:ubiquinone/menaquinone biosynthesis C-methylase UbiE
VTTPPAVFDETIPEAYDRYLGPLLFQPYATDLAARLEVGPAMRILELACGTGVVTRALLARLRHDATLLATDLSEQMLAAAQKQVLADPRLAWQPADATRLAFDDDSFDAVVCQFGAMFFVDKARAFAGMHRVLRPGGRLLLNTWDSVERNGISRAAQRVMTRLFPVDTPRFFEVPHSFHDTAVIHGLVEDAGFSDIGIEIVAAEGHSPCPLDAATGLVKGSPVATQVRERGASIEQTVAATARELEAEYGPGPLRVPLSAVVVIARARARA